MATYTFETGQNEEAVLTAAATLRGKTNQETLQESLDQAVMGFARAGNRYDAGAVETAYAKTPSVEKRNQIRTILELPPLSGVKSPLWIEEDPS